ncbi:C4-dicarboxylate ABC transporter [Desulfobacter hydrogenophilus]|uniref:C4-dicarboxylate ABC transporter n=1 Tax=Desulfobacter hydrogenophilus TaxID=2291 RepID=A0A328FE68_9BACT|nr:TRAP transporter large permease subunit [Desulfobacter hydrogenophilus]NDY72150.1 TRAP transporter large permease subunit [Desulfobacter hydrogenophilus]QBH14875.1 TRAP transporter large permease subunit [Desulfobacter hydrogenophilus]RAM01383.1 C4-dicarboxylate ABC transporter [Desulfobacter hydrogenophilus]
MTTGMILALLMFVCLLIGLSLGHPLAFTLGGLAVIFGYFGWGPECFGMFIDRIYMSTMNSYILVAVPLFVLMANFLDRSGVMEGLFVSVRYLLGPVRGGIGMTVILVATIFAACTGIVGASVVTIALLATPPLLEYGYKKELIAGSICAGGTLGILIPPSIMLVLMGSYAGVPVGQLFMGALIPGAILSGLYILYIAIICFIKPEWGPALTVEERAAVPTQKVLIDCLKNLFPPALLIASVLGAIFAGVATPTEAAGMGAFVALLMMIAYGRFSFKIIKDSVIATSTVTSMVLFIVVGATCFTGVFIGLGGDELVEVAILSVGSKWGSFALMMLIVLFLGMFIDWIGITMICLPLFVPIARDLGFNELWFVMMIAMNLQMSFLTPPLGYAFFYFKGAGGATSQIEMIEIYRGMIPFILIMLSALALCILFPQTVLYLPEMMN